MSNKEFKELLTLAAKAAGYQVCHFGCPFPGAFVADDLKGLSFYWNPRDSSAEAFELAVKLRLRVECCDNGRIYVWRGAALVHRGVALHENNDAEMNAAARLAILRAAAEIGRNMP